METWLNTSAPLYVVAGEYDWMVSLDDSRLLVDRINQKTPGRASLYVAKGMDHQGNRYGNDKLD